MFNTISLTDFNPENDRRNKNPIFRHIKSNNSGTAKGLFKKKWLQCEKNVQIKLTPKNFLLIIFNVVYIEVNETRKNYEQISNKLLRTFY